MQAYEKWVRVYAIQQQQPPPRSGHWRGGDAKSCSCSSTSHTPTHGRFLFPWPEYLEGSNISENKGLPIAHPSELIDPRYFARAHFAANWFDPRSFTTQRFASERQEYVGEGRGGARGSRLSAETHWPPQLFGAERIPPRAPLGAPHPPTRPSEPFGAPEGRRNPTCNPSKIKGLHVLLLKKFRRVAGRVAPPFPGAKGFRILPFPKRQRDQDLATRPSAKALAPPPVRSA